MSEITVKAEGIFERRRVLVQKPKMFTKNIRCFRIV